MNETSRTSRADLRQHYKLNPPAMGVYRITNTRTGACLLDASRNIEGALNRHRFELRQGMHRNRALQVDWKALGEAAFRFETVDVLEPRDEPSFDADVELAVLLEIWLEKHPAGAPLAYHAPKR